MTRKQALKLAETKFWETMSDKDIVMFQLFEERLCMPFDRFQEALQAVLNRPVFTHELAFADALRKEVLGEKPAPTLEEIMNLLPNTMEIHCIFSEE